MRLSGLKFRSEGRRKKKRKEGGGIEKARLQIDLTYEKRNEIGRERESV